jgi:hypothetical protein
MSVEYVNRRGETYYLNERPGPSTGSRYTFSRKPSRTPAQAIPHGYEIRELPDSGQVVLRKIKPGVIASLERQLVSSAVRSQTGLKHFIVDAEGESLIVYLPGLEESEADVLLEMLGGSDQRTRAAKDEMVRKSRYRPMMRFVLVDEENRLFHVERWCFLGGIDKWVFLDGPAALVELVDKYVKHLGKESFFELM